MTYKKWLSAGYKNRSQLNIPEHERTGSHLFLTLIWGRHSVRWLDIFFYTNCATLTVRSTDCRSLRLDTLFVLLTSKFPGKTGFIPTLCAPQEIQWIHKNFYCFWNCSSLSCHVTVTCTYRHRLFYKASKNCSV